ncbi:MAG: dephospho-CoA kinase [Desulfovibrio sp.]
MRRVVVTGNPGSGKSAFSQCLADMAVPVFSADATVAALYAPRGEAAQWIGQIGGSALLTPAGAVDKTALLEAMRANPALRREVENMVHSLTHKALETFWIKQESLGAPLAVAEVPLYFETGWQNSFSPEPHVVGVRCAMPLRAQRIEANRGWTQDKLEAIEGWQWTQDRKMAACNTVVDNQGTLESLCAQAKEFLASMRAQDQKEEQALALHLAGLWR